MNVLITLAVVVVVLLLLGAALAVKIIKQYEQGVLFRLGRVLGTRDPGLRVIIPFADTHGHQPDRPDHLTQGGRSTHPG